MANLSKKIIFNLFILTTLLISPFLLRAEEKEEAKDCFSQELEASVKYDARSDAKTQAGSVGIIKADYLYKYDFKAFGKLPVGLSLYNRYTGIDSTVSNVHLPARLIELATSIETTLPFFKFNNTYFRIGVSPSFYSDKWNFPASSFKIPSYYYAIYCPNPKWTFLFGVYVFPDTQNPVLPIPGVIYKPNERLTFYLAPRRPNIEYALTKKISVFWEGSFFVDNEYEVKFDDTRNAVLRFYETYTGGGIKYKPNKFIQASLSVGGNFWRRFTYDDSLGKVNMKNSVYTQLRVTIAQ
ncbi:MAG: hypothetical protein PHC54_03290 [Candidatus Omnitrophica bacterium]|nr:hypothetical protein [Candidatus Omnitrophota bacterium]MDD5592426.1 hypothetical protein [Candidatus Omnitrophota bacterium]